MVYTNPSGAGAFSCFRDMASIGAQGGEGVPTTEATASEQKQQRQRSAPPSSPKCHLEARNAKENWKERERGVEGEGLKREEDPIAANGRE